MNVYYRCHIILHWLFGVTVWTTGRNCIYHRQEMGAHYSCYCIMNLCSVYEIMNKFVILVLWYVISMITGFIFVLIISYCANVPHRKGMLLFKKKLRVDESDYFVLSFWFCLDFYYPIQLIYSESTKNSCIWLVGARKTINVITINIKLLWLSKLVELWSCSVYF